MMTRQLPISTLAALFLFTEMALAAPRSPPQLLVDEAYVDFPTHTITIRGQHFDNSGALKLTLGSFRYTSDRCVADVQVVPHTNVCEFSPGGLPVDGDYLLTVSRGSFPIQIARYALTIGAVGPVGIEAPQKPQGETGAVGATGAQGTVGPAGPQCPKGWML